jgi:hypothetical protein
MADALSMNAQRNRKFPMAKHKGFKTSGGGNSVEVMGGAWERFERAVDTVVKGGPQHKEKNRDGRIGKRNEKPRSRRDSTV